MAKKRGGALTVIELWVTHTKIWYSTRLFVYSKLQCETQGID